MFVPLMVEGAFFIDTLEGMRPEVIAQGLDEVGPCLGTAVSVEVLKAAEKAGMGSPWLTARPMMRRRAL